MTIHPIDSVRHTSDYVLLIGLLSVGFLGLGLFNYDRAAQVAIIVALVVLYIFWGTYHHHHDGNLTTKVILEYIGFALLISAVLIISLLRI